MRVHRVAALLVVGICNSESRASCAVCVLGRLSCLRRRLPSLRYTCRLVSVLVDNEGRLLVQTRKIMAGRNGYRRREIK